MCGKQKADSVNFVIFDFVSEWKIRAFPLGKYWPCQRKINILFASRLIEDDNGGTKNRVHLLFEHFAWQRCAAGSILIFSLERVISSICSTNFNEQVIKMMESCTTHKIPPVYNGNNERPRRQRANIHGWQIVDNRISRCDATMRQHHRP